MSTRIAPYGRAEDNVLEGVYWDAECIRQFPMQGLIESAFPRLHYWAVDNPEAWAVIERTEGPERARELRQLVVASMTKASPDVRDVHVDVPLPKRKRKRRKARAAGYSFLSKRRAIRRPFFPPTPGETALREALLAAPAALGRPTDESILRSMESGNAGPVVASLNWRAFETKLHVVVERVLLEELREEGERTKSKPVFMQKGALAPAVLTLVFNALNPRVFAWARRHTAALVTNISEQVREAIREVIITAYQDGIAPYDAVPLIRAALGEPALFPRWQKAVYNFMADLLERGIEYERAETLTQGYRERLIKTRAATIARTEILAAQNAGRMETYQQSIDEGWLDPTMRKQWLAAPEGPCPICEALDGTQAGWGAEFTSALFTGAGPPAHPNCRCTFIMVEPS